MKRIVVVLLSLILLCACVPTPEEEFVVNKGDDTAEHQIRGNEVSGAQRFPERWDEEELLQCGLISVSFHADILQRSDGIYPVLRTKRHVITQENAAAFLLKMLGTPKERCKLTPTKDDWQREFQAWVDDYNAFAAGNSNSGELSGQIEALTAEQYEEQAAWYAEQINNAPISNDPEPVSDFSSLPMNNLGARYTMEDGTAATVAVAGGESSDYLEVYLGAGAAGDLMLKESYETQTAWYPGLVGKWKDVSMERSAAETVLMRTLERLGLTDFSVVRADQANLMQVHGSNDTMYTSIAQGWGFRLLRTYGGYPTLPTKFEPSISLNYTDGPAYAEVTVIPCEELYIMIDESGLLSFEYRSPKDVVGVESANVTLLPFDEVQTRVKNVFRATLSGSWYEKEDVSEIEVYRMVLTAYTVHIRNSDDYYEIPCWVILYDNPKNRTLRDNPTHYPEALLINAIDGSVIHTGY